MSFSLENKKEFLVTQVAVGKRRVEEALARCHNSCIPPTECADVERNGSEAVGSQAREACDVVSWFSSGWAHVGHRAGEAAFLPWVLLKELLIMLLGLRV